MDESTVRYHLERQTRGAVNGRSRHTQSCAEKLVADHHAIIVLDGPDEAPPTAY